MSIYQELKAVGVPLDNHESDLYALITPESTRIVKGYAFRGSVRVFTGGVDGKRWYDIPFAFDPFWNHKV